MAAECSRNCHPRISKEMASGSSEEMRDWTKLPPEIMIIIFLKLGFFETLMNAQWVCSEWKKITFQPHLWRSIRLPRHWDKLRMPKVAREAADRSNGQLEELFIEDFATDELLQYVISRSKNLRRLGLAYCYEVSDDGLIDMAKRLPLLEEVELRFCSFSPEVVEAFGKQCPQLKSFRLDCPEKCMGVDEYALAIAETMPHIRHLRLFLNQLSKDDVKAILDGCPHLESLDFSQKNDLLMDDKDLRKRCVDAGLKTLGVPNYVDEIKFEDDDFEVPEDGSFVDEDDGGMFVDFLDEDYSELEHYSEEEE